MKIKLILISYLIVFSHLGFTLDTKGCKDLSLGESYLNANNPAYLQLNNYKYVNQKLPPKLRYLDNYRIIASAQFTESQFINAIQNKGKVVDVDLRAEYHGFNNGIPFSYIALPYDNVNFGKSQDIILKEEHQILYNDLVHDKYIKFYRNNLKDIPNVNSPTMCMASSIKSESDLVAKYNQEYYRITATDHLALSPDNIDHLLALYDARLKSNPNQWVYLHCQGGAGRTTTATAILIMLKQKSAKSLMPFDELIKYVEQVSSYRLVPNCRASDKSYRCQAKWQRYQMLQQVYDFVQKRNGQESYTSWASRH